MGTAQYIEGICTCQASYSHLRDPGSWSSWGRRCIDDQTVHDIVRYVNLSNIHLTGDDKQIVAAATGAILGALGAYFVGLFVQRRIRKAEAKREERVRLREYTQSVVMAEAYCREVLVVLYDAERLLGECAEKIQQGGWMMNLPRMVSMSEVSVMDFQNEQLITDWMALRFRVDKLNHLIREFHEHYTTINKEYSSMALHGQDGVPEVVEDNDQALHSLALKVQVATGETIRIVKHVYALIIAHTQLSNHILITNTEELSKLRVIESHYDKIRSRLDKRFSQEALYGAPKTPPPVPAPEDDSTQNTAPSPAAS